MKLVEAIRQKAEVLYQPIIGSTRFMSERYPERNYQKLTIKPYILIFRQIGQVVFVNRIFDTRQHPGKLDLQYFIGPFSSTQGPRTAGKAAFVFLLRQSSMRGNLCQPSQ